MNLSQDLIKGSIVPIVLSLLKESPTYGYEIVKAVNARTNGLLQWKEGTLYPTLHRLEAGGLIKGKWQEALGGSGGARKRKYYHITRRGLTELARRSQEWKDFSCAVSAILLGA